VTRDPEKRLQELAELKENWDSSGANPIDPEALESARIFMSRTVLPDIPLPCIVPTCVGGVCLEWSTPGRDISVTFNPGQEFLELEVYWTDHFWTPALDEAAVTTFLFQLLSHTQRSTNQEDRE
jgi:hypothetical protein